MAKQYTLFGEGVSRPKVAWRHPKPKVVRKAKKVSKSKPIRKKAGQKSFAFRVETTYDFDDDIYDAFPELLQD